MSVSKRVGAVLCALALLLHLAFFPLRVRATVAAGALTAVGLAVTVSAFLNLAGIYPFNPDTGAGVTFPEWSQDALQALINQYNAVHASTPITEQSIRGYAVGGVIAVANASWAKLRDFVQWVRDTYAPADNSENVRLGVVSGAGVPVPYVSASLGAGNYFDYVAANGIYVGDNLVNNVVRPYYVLALQNFDSMRLFYVQISDTLAQIWAFSSQDYDSKGIVAAYYRGGKESYMFHTSSSQYERVTLDGVTYVVWGYANLIVSVLLSTVPSDVTVYSSKEAAARAFLGLSADSEKFSGITADTAEVITPPASDSDLIGLQIAGLGQGVTVEALEGVIESGVQNREQPTVRQVEVEIQAGTEVDTETGEVVENPVVIDQADVIPSVAALTAPQAFLDALTTTMTTKFPFCLPFDIMRILSAFVKEPRAPVISLTFHDGFSDADYTISVDLAPWDDVAAVVRQLESILLLLGFWMNFDKFNVLNIILGQLG